MRGIRDQLAKQVATTMLRPDGKTSTEEEVRPSDAQRIDIWFVPAEHAARSCPGMLRRMTAKPSMLEPFYKTPSADEVRNSIRKQLSWEHVLSQDESPPPTTPWLWIISSGRPNRALEGLGLSPREGWPAGVYALAPRWSVFLVVLNELPRTRDTLMLRLMGAGRVFANAVKDLEALPGDAPEKAFEERLRLFCHWLEIKMKKTPLTEEEEDILSATKDLYDKFIEDTRRKALEQGIEQGIEKGIEQGIEKGIEQGREQAAVALRAELAKTYSNRFGTCPARIRKMLQSADFARLFQWVSPFSSRSEEEIARMLGAQSK